ncbi:hypothetical protein J2S40_004506 [Nocardioides luteus]|nr:hypothetical protein [Nocardioides luteus]MDR7313448.1 hypothetical protein [Nocardioides luteus]
MHVQRQGHGPAVWGDLRRDDQRPVLDLSAVREELDRVARVPGKARGTG